MAEVGNNVAYSTASSAYRKATALKIVMPEAGDLTAVSVYLSDKRTNNNLEAAIYSHDSVNNLPLNRLGNWLLGSAPANGWNTIPASYPGLVSGQTYWLAIVAKSDKVNYGLGANNGSRWSAGSGADYAMPTPWTSLAVFTTSALMIYGTYTPSGGGETKTVGESGIGADVTGGVVVSLGLGDAGNGAELFTGQAELALSETGAGADLLLLYLQLLVAENALGNDLIALYQELIRLVTESGSGAEQLSGQAAAGVLDEGSAADQLLILAGVGLIDQGVALDALNVYQQLLKLISESGSATEQSTAAVSLQVSDNATAQDIAGIIAVLLLSDAAAASDLIAVIKEAIKSIAESGTGFDALSITAVLELAESGTAEDLAGLVYKALAILEQLAGADGLTVLRDTLREQLRYLVRYKLQTQFSKESMQRLFKKK